MQIIDDFAASVKVNYAELRRRISERKIYYYGGDLDSRSYTEPQSVLPIFHQIIGDLEVKLLGFAGKLGFYATEYVYLKQEAKLTQKTFYYNAELQHFSDNLQRENAFLRQRVKALVGEKVKLNEQRFREVADLQQRLRTAGRGPSSDVANEVFINAKDNLYNEIDQIKAKLAASRAEAEQLKLDYLELKDANENYALRETRLMLKIDALETRSQLLAARLNIEKVDAETQSSDQQPTQQAKRHQQRKEAQARYLTDIRHVFRPPGAASDRELGAQKTVEKAGFSALLDQAKRPSKAQVDTAQPTSSRIESLRRGRALLDNLSIGPIAGLAAGSTGGGASCEFFK